LYERAREVHDQCSRTLGAKDLSAAAEEPPAIGLWTDEAVPPHMIRLFREAFTVLDVSQHVLSFGINEPSSTVLRIMEERSFDVAVLRDRGAVAGYLHRNDLGTGACGEHLRAFRKGQVIPGDGALHVLVRALTVHENAFVTVLGEVVGVADRASLNTPVARMWLFGIVTMTEMLLTRLVDQFFPGGAWRSRLSAGRVEKAIVLQQERERRGQHGSLLSCLQLSDKAQILIERPEMLGAFGFPSKKFATAMIKELESLRNNLAHSQDIVAHDWAAIARLASRIEDAADQEPDQ
jgi:hypothetical protein